MIINIAIHKAFISHNLVNKLFVAKMSFAKKTLIFEKAYANKKNKLMQINSKKLGHNHCNLSIYAVIIHIFIII